MTRRQKKAVYVKIVRHRIHDEITEVQTEKLREIYSKIGRTFYKNTFEQFERGFLFISDIERDIKWWAALNDVFQRCLDGFPGIDENELASATVLISLGVGAGNPDIDARAIQYLKAQVPSRSSFMKPTDC